ncbi:ureidoglycolate dehydrogenase [Escherichia coli]|nr:ureidoglycolate dehydrogenase [Escherichia coli]
MMMIDVLSGVLLGLPFGRQVSSMYDDLHAGRNLGQLHIVINPNFFSSSELFRQHLSQTMRELNAITPAPGFNQVYYPGQDQDIKQRKAAVEGIEIVDDIYQYLISDALYNTSYETKKSLCAIIIETGLSYDYTFPSSYRRKRCPGFPLLALTQRVG